MPRKTKPLPSADFLRDRLNYDPDTGVLTWSPTHRLAGKVAGCVDTTAIGYKCITVMVDYKAYKAHRVAWKIMTGEEPPSEIDHEDGDGTNNRWVNLRDGSNGVNNMNVATSRLNKLGVKGVYAAKNGKTYNAAIYVQKKRIYLGTFRTVEDAEKAVLEARKGHGFGPRHGARLPPLICPKAPVSDDLS